MPPLKVQKTVEDYQPLDKNTEKKIMQAMTEYLVTTMQSYNVVNHEKFITMLRIIYPRHKFPGRKFFSEAAVPKLYNETVSKIKGILSHVNETEVAITIDCWPSVSNTSFLEIIVHFVSSKWEFINICLNWKHFNDDHTADNVGQMLTDTMSEWGH